MMVSVENDEISHAVTSGLERLAKSAAKAARRQGAFEHLMAARLAAEAFLDIAHEAECYDRVIANVSDTVLREFIPHLAPAKAKGRRSKYPWHLLQAKFDKFTIETEPGIDKEKVRASICASAHRTFGPGMISTAIVSAGVLVIRNKD